MLNALTVRVITSREDWNTLRSEWNNLLLQSSAPSVYLTHEWLTTWWDCIAGPNATLNILVIERGGRIVAIAPLMMVVKRVLGIPVRKIQFISTMKKPAHLSTISAHLDIIALSEEEDAMLAIFEHLEREGARWDYLQLYPIPDDSRTLLSFDAFGARRSLRYLLQPAFHSSLLRIDCSWEEYTTRHRREIKKVIKSPEASQSETTGLRVAKYSSLEDVPGGFETLLDIERRSWKWNKGVSLNSALFRDFYRQFALNIGRQGMLIIHILEMDGRPIAYNYAIQFGNVIWGQRMSFDDSYRNRSPGKYLIYHLLQLAHEKHLTAVDFGWGDAHGQYKTSMTNARLQYSELMVFADSLRGRISRSYFGSPRLRVAVDYMSDFKRRIARHLGIRLATSELTRMDQLRHHGRNEAATI